MRQKKTKAGRTPVQARGKISREAIILAADKVLAEEGFDGFSLPKVAERAGLSKSAVYPYFPNASAIYIELARHHFIKYRLEMVAHMSGMELRPENGNIRFYCDRLLEGSVAFLREHPSARMLTVGGNPNRRVWEIETSNRYLIAEYFAAFLPDQIATHLESKTDFIFSLVGMMNGMLYWAHRVDPNFDKDTVRLISIALAARLQRAMTSQVRPMSVQ